jgi:hypothetical protein
VHFISIKPVFSNHLSYVTLFQCSHGRLHKTGLTVVEYFVFRAYLISYMHPCFCENVFWSFVILFSITYVYALFFFLHIIRIVYIVEYLMYNAWVCLLLSNNLLPNPNPNLSDVCHQVYKLTQLGKTRT